MDEAIELCSKGIGELSFISDKTKKPDLILASAGDTPTIEVIAAKKILSKLLPNLKVRVISVIDLMKLDCNHPHGLNNREYNSLFTKDKPIIFNFHGYPSLVHTLTYNRTNKNLHVHGYMEEGTITTPFDMRVINKIDRYHLILNALKYLEIDNDSKSKVRNYCNKMLRKHKKYIRENGIDMENIDNFMNFN